MLRPVRRAAVMVAIGALALPATAAADVSSADVSAHIRSADRALVQLRSAVGADRARAARSALRRARHETAVASKLSRRLAKSARRGTGQRAAVRSLKLVAVGYDGMFAELTALVGTADGALQADIARSLLPSLNGRELALDVLASLMPLLADGPQAMVAGVLGTVAGDESAVISQLAGITEIVPAHVAEVVAQAMATSSALLEVTASRFGEMLPFVPPIAAGQLEAAFGIVAAQLGQVAALLDQVLATVTAVLGESGAVVAGQLAMVSELISKLIGEDGPLGAILGGSGAFDLAALLGGLPALIGRFIPSFLPQGLVPSGAR